MISEDISIFGRAVLKTYLWDDSEELKIKSRPAVLVLPGGGYIMCSDREAEPIALKFMAEGFNAFVLRYSLTGNFKDCFADAEKAMEIILDKAEEWKIDKRKISVCGFSAGGHLACALGVMGRNRPAAMILGYPAVKDEYWIGVGKERCSRSYRKGGQYVE